MDDAESVVTGMRARLLGLVAALVLGIAMLAMPEAQGGGSHGLTWSFSQGGIEAKFRGYHYNDTVGENPVAWTSNVQYTCLQGVRLTHSFNQMTWKYSVHPHNLVVQSGPFGATTVSSLHYSQHCLNGVGTTRTLN